MEPFTSAKSTVTFFRSPSRTDFDRRILSARWRGVYSRGARSGRVARRVAAAPHSGQNFARAGSSASQASQQSARAAPHSTQNLARAGLECRQLSQTMASRLYNMKSDRTELNDVSEDQPEVLVRMIQTYEDWAERVGALPWPVIPEVTASPRPGTRHIHEVR